MPTIQLDRAGFTIWLTGMSGAGKSTLAAYLAQKIRQLGRFVEILDGEVLEKSQLILEPNATKEQRNEVVRRLGHLAKLLTRNGVVTLVAADSPYREAREMNRREIGRFVEVFVDAPVEQLIARDTKGNYRRALAGELPNFVGITEPYEPPVNPELVVKTHVEKVEVSAQSVLQMLLDLGYLSSVEVTVLSGQRARRRLSPKARSSKAGVGGSRRPAKRRTAAASSVKRTNATATRKHRSGKASPRSRKR